MSDRPPSAARPSHLRLSSVVLVWLGGTLGTASRFSLGAALPRVGDVPVATAGINVLGALALGLLLAPRDRPPLWSGGQRGHQGRRRAVTLFLGTGFLGGFTTYSALALDTAALGQAGRLGWAAAYAVGTVVVGAAASFAGMMLAARIRR